MSSWNISKIDIYDPSLVLYAPLWRPDMVARGGGIKNGTGTLAASPLNLGVGANTVTVSGLGTFVVTMPEGGTVASGTTTVSGSPVTVSAGIAATITTTGSTGNIICTPSNIIGSKDRSNHTATIIGATWSSQGRTFDGTDDQILTGSITHNIDTGDFTVLVWARCTRTPSGAGDDAILAFGAYAPALYFDADSTVESRFGIYWGAWYPSGSSLVVNTWYLLGLHRSGTTVSWSINAAQTVNTYSIATSIANGALVLSSENTTANAKGIQGSIGEVALWTRFLPLAERQRFLQATKWRY